MWIWKLACWCSGITSDILDPVLRWGQRSKPWLVRPSVRHTFLSPIGRTWTPKTSEVLQTTDITFSDTGYTFCIIYAIIAQNSPLISQVFLYPFCAWNCRNGGSSRTIMDERSCRHDMMMCLNFIWICIQLFVYTNLFVCDCYSLYL